MYNAKLMFLLKVIHEEKQFISLQRYLQRQYDNDSVLEFRLWKYLKRHITRQGFESKQLARKCIEEKVFDNNAKALNRTASRLYRRVKRFMIDGFLDKNAIIEDWLFRESLNNEKSRLKALVTDRLINDERKGKTETERKLQLFIKFHLNYEKYRKEALRNNDVDLFNRVRALLNEFYLKYYEILEIEKGQRAKMKKEEVVDLITPNTIIPAKTRVELLLKKAKQLETHPEYFEECKNTFLVLLNQEIIESEMKSVLYSMIFNFAARQANKGINKYLLSNIEYFIDVGFGKKILYENNEIPIFIYTNILSLIAINAKTELIEDYASKYLEDVEPKEIKKARFFTKIFIAFYNENYEQVIEIIHINENNVTVGFDYSLRVRIWRFLACSYFELNNSEALMKTLQSFKRYVRGQTISDVNKQMNYNFMIYVRKIYNCTNKEVLLLIDQDLNNEKVIVYKKWLLKKIKESHSKFP